MTIRHLVTWKLVATDPAEKALAAQEMRVSLEALAVKIPRHITSLKVRSNVAYLETNWDVILDSEFASLADLEAYRTHPLHQEVVGVISRLIASRASIDIEM